MDEKEKDYALKDILVADPNGDQTLQKAVVETVRGNYTLEYQNNDFIRLHNYVYKNIFIIQKNGFQTVLSLNKENDKQGK